MNETHKKIYLTLADMFFLDQDPSTQNLIYASKLLNENNWGKEKTKRVLVTIIAPIYARNIGHGIYPVIGIWDGFDEQELVDEVDKRIKKINKNKVFFKKLQDKFYTYLMEQLEWQNLINLIDKE